MAVRVIAKTIDLESWILLDHVNLPCVRWFSSGRNDDGGVWSQCDVVGFLCVMATMLALDVYKRRVGSGH